MHICMWKKNYIYTHSVQLCIMQIYVYTHVYMLILNSMVEHLLSIPETLNSVPSTAK